MKYTRKAMAVILVFLVILTLFGCGEKIDPPIENEGPDQFDTIAEKVNWWIENLTLDEKVGQMIQAERSGDGGNSGITIDEVTQHNIGSVLNGGGNHPSSNTVNGWYNMFLSYNGAAKRSSSGIPLLYGVDAVHGHSNLQNATIFPHNIGLAAANDAELMYLIGKATAYELRQTGLNYNFSPSLGIVKDKRWGRTYETFGENPEVALNLIPSYIEGLQEYQIAATAKHFVGDGYTTWGTGLYGRIDRGDATISDDELENYFLPLYQEAIDAGVKSIMVSYSALNGTRMHENYALITQTLKGDMGFKGIVISDYNGIDDITKSEFADKVVEAVNAGIDMLMQPSNFISVLASIKQGVRNGDIEMSRIDDAVSRILTVKYEIGLFETKERVNADLRNETQLALAREAVRKSLVMLKNDQNVLPLDKDMDLLVVGPGSNNIGVQSGGWTMYWQGGTDIVTQGTTILQAFQNETTGTIYTDISDISLADAVILVLAEKPYAEMVGDSEGLNLDHPDIGFSENITLIQALENAEIPVITVLVAGRPLLINDYIDQWDAFVMAFLPGTEGAGITDVLYGDFDFTGTLPFTYPMSIEQADDTMLDEDYDPEIYQFAYGTGMTYGG